MNDSLENELISRLSTIEYYTNIKFIDYFKYINLDAHNEYYLCDNIKFEDEIREIEKITLEQYGIEYNDIIEIIKRFIINEEYYKPKYEDFDEGAYHTICEYVYESEIIYKYLAFNLKYYTNISWYEYIKKINNMNIKNISKKVKIFYLDCPLLKHNKFIHNIFNNSLFIDDLILLNNIYKTKQ